MITSLLEITKKQKETLGDLYIETTNEKDKQVYYNAIKKLLNVLLPYLPKYPIKDVFKGNENNFPHITDNGSIVKMCQFEFIYDVSYIFRGNYNMTYSNIFSNDILCMQDYDKNIYFYYRTINPYGSDIYIKIENYINISLRSIRILYKRLILTYTQGRISVQSRFIKELKNITNTDSLLRDDIALQNIKITIKEDTKLLTFYAKISCNILKLTSALNWSCQPTWYEFHNRFQFLFFITKYKLLKDLDDDEVKNLLIKHKIGQLENLLKK